MAKFYRRKTKSKIIAFPKSQRMNKHTLRHPHLQKASPAQLTFGRRSIYLLPNAFTTAALFCGFYAIVMAINLKFDQASIAIFAAMVFDGLDGRIARLTNTQSAFGVQYDSLSDMVSFGVAPALVTFNWALLQLGKIGWSVAFLYATCAALRLARFNTQVETADKNYFTGLASPAAAAILASIVWVGADNTIVMNKLIAMGVCAVVAIAGILMVTNIKYYSFKGLDFKSRVPFFMIVAAALLFALVQTDPPIVLLILATIYALSGPVMSFFLKSRV
jgi:CDP-diacylglycerol--serine O-phosphatidyltransferase